jgi:uncharacterized protein (TIGR00730 family)
MSQSGRRRYDVRDPDLAHRIDDLMADMAARYQVDPESDQAESLRQMLVTVTRLAGDGASSGNLKLLNNALKELRHAFRVFAPYRPLRKVACFGSARTGRGHPDYEQARAFAERIVAEGWMVITGAGGGIMEAAQGGAGREASFGVNIRLPFEQEANPVIAGDEKLINFRYFFTRKVMFVKESHAIVLLPGGFGTHDEGFEALTLIQTGKSEVLPVVFLDSPGGSYWRDWQRYVESHLGARGLISAEDLALFEVTDDVDVAVKHLCDFYSNYHSSRHVRDELLIRVRRAPDADQLERLNDEFADLLEEGRIEVTGPLPAERGEAPGLSRVSLHPHRKKVGRLRELIDRLNTLVPEAESSPRGALPHEIVAEPVPYEQEMEEGAETGE